MKITKFAAITIILLLFLSWLCAVQVAQKEFVVIKRLNSFVRSYDTPGLKFRIPFFEGEIHIDRRLQSLDLDPKVITTSDRKSMEIDGFALFRVVEPIKYLYSGGSMEAVKPRLLEVVYSELVSELGRHSFEDILTSGRTTAMDAAEKLINTKVEYLGVTVKILRLNKTDLPPSNKSAVFGRMQADQHKIAEQLLAEGDSEFQKIVSEAKKSGTEIESNAYLESQKIIAEARKQEKEILAEAYKKDPAFYRFWRQLESRKRIAANSPVEIIYENGKEPHNITSPQQ